MGHVASFIELPSLLQRKEAKIAEVIHEGSRSPTEDELDLGGIKAHCMENAGCTDTERVRSPKSNGLLVFITVETVNSDSRILHGRFDFVGGDELDSVGGGITKDSERCMEISAGTEGDEAADDAENGTD